LECTKETTHSAITHTIEHHLNVTQAELNKLALRNVSWLAARQYAFCQVSHREKNLIYKRTYQREYLNEKRWARMPHSHAPISNKIDALFMRGASSGVIFGAREENTADIECANNERCDWAQRIYFSLGGSNRGVSKIYSFAPDTPPLSHLDDNKHVYSHSQSVCIRAHAA